MTKLCEVAGCSAKIRTKKMCNRHHLQTLRHGTTFSTVYEPRKIIIERDIAKVPLGVGGQNGYARIDKWDVPKVKAYKWHLDAYGYAKTSTNNTTIFLHRLITGAPKGQQVDHINHDLLDNRQVNLRVCSHVDNHYNLKHRVGQKYKGITKNRGGGYWARITYNYKSIHIGTFATAEEAARAYNAKAIELHGDFASLNSVE